ncbi:MAG: hypothetical protein VYE18_03160 [Pseudomonadota bacterium]|nr:hypothetical protein [Pseudomonadota bacterium]
MFDLQKKEKAARVGTRVIAKQIEPFFSGMLVLGSAFMAIMLFGTGSILGGLIFLFPVAIAAFAYWEDSKPNRGDKFPDTSQNDPRDRYGA